MKPHKNVITEVVDASMCIGCGVCAGVCPHNTIHMAMSKQGIYHPETAGKNCPEKCGQCLNVCPSAENKLNEDAIANRQFGNIPGIRYSKIAGYYLHNYAGYSTIHNHRSRGASGGLATWTLETLLKERMIDHVVCVRPTSDPSRFFEFTVCTTADQIRDCSRSCYYPVEISEAIRYVLTNEGRYAVIGLPCVCKAIRLAQQQIPALARRICFVLGLVCGQTKSRYFMDAMSTSKLPDFRELQRVQFRIKTPGRKANDIGFEFDYLDTRGTRRQQVLYWSKDIGTWWNDGLFTPSACFFCDDIFAECADAAFMDAWHKDYESDPDGTSIVLIRNPSLNSIFNQFRREQLAVSSIPISKTLLSQMGVVISKRTDLRHRISLLKLNLIKRTGLSRRTLHPCRSQYAQLRHEIAAQSTLCWSENPGDAALLHRTVVPLQQQIQQYKKQRYCFRLLNWLSNQIACRM